MVVHNEETLLPRALKSVADICDEIVIVHDGDCSDRTLDIAREYTDKVFVRHSFGAPEPHRPFSFSQAKNDWILQLDADEYLGDDMREALPEMIKQDVPGYTVKWLEDLNGTLFFNMIKEVLFRKERIFFIGSPCEYVKPVNPDEKLAHAEVSVINSAKQSNYSSWKEYSRKYRKFAQLQAATMAVPFSEVNTWNYSGDDWDRNTRLKINHPLILGVIGMNLKYLFAFFKKIIGTGGELSWQAIWHLMWYNTVVYSEVFKRNHRW